MIKSITFTIYTFENSIEINQNNLNMSEYLDVDYDDIDELIELLQEAKLERQNEN